MNMPIAEAPVSLDFLREEYLTEEEVCSILRIKKTTLSSRRACGTEHPPYLEMGRVRLYPKKMFKDWLSKRPIIWEVKSA